MFLLLYELHVWSFCVPDSMQWSPWGGSHSTYQDITYHLWNLNVYSFFIKPSVDPILSQLHPVWTFLSNFIKIIISVILSSTTWHVKCFLLLQFFFYYTLYEFFIWPSFSLPFCCFVCPRYRYSIVVNI